MTQGCSLPRLSGASRRQGKAVLVAVVGAVAFVGGPAAFAQSEEGRASALPASSAIDAHDEVLPATSQFDPQMLDAELVYAVESAISSHPSLEMAKYVADASSLDVKAAKGQRLPSVSVEAMALETVGNGLNGPVRSVHLQPQLVVDEPLWTWGRIDRGVDRAKLNRLSALANYDEIALSVGLAIVQAYFDFSRLTDELDILKVGLEKHAQMVRSMERRVAQEVSPQSDLELARSRASQAELETIQARAQIAEVLQQLRELIGDPQFTPTRRSPRVGQWSAAKPDLLIDQALKYDPGLRRLRLDARAADAAARAARASIWPQLSAQYSYDEVYGHRIGLVLKAQSDGGLSRFDSAQAARLRSQADVSQVAAAERELRAQIVRDYEEYKANRDRMGNAQLAAGAAERVMDSYMRQFLSGRRTWLDVMNAVREMTTAQIEVVNTHAGEQAACARLALRTGLWRPDAKGGSR